MNLQTKIQNYINEFETKQRDDGTSYTYLKDRKSKIGKKLDKALMQANGEGFPKDATFTYFLSCLEGFIEYDLTQDDNYLDDIRAEIVDGLVDMYTADLTKWLASDIANVYYLTEALTEYQSKDGFQLLAFAQYRAIDEIMGEVISLLEG